MQASFQESLTRFRVRLVELTGLAESAMARATAALLDDDLALADEVIGEDAPVRALHRALDREALALLAEGEAVGEDLRTIVAGLRVSDDLERMGMLARHVAEAAEQNQHQVVPDSLRPTIAGMDVVARRLAARARGVIVSADADAAMELARDDDEMDRLQESLTRQLLDLDRQADMETALDLTLLGRYYERYAEHAVSVAFRVTSLTGELSEAGISGDAAAG
jgi:phosphate transport system protein